MRFDATTRLVWAKEGLVRRVSKINLRRYAIMQSLFNNHKRKLIEEQTGNGAKKSKTGEPATRDEKLTTLLRVLDDVLAEDGLDEMAEAMGKAAFNDALNLRYSIRMQVLNVNPSPGCPAPRPGRAAPATPSAPSSPSLNLQGSLKRNLTLPKLVPNSDLGPWESAMIPDRLPKLPPVLDPTLENGAFIHQGYSSGRVTDMTYERLEWIGDSFIYYLSSLLISKTFPSLLPGKCTQFRERLVKNLTLSKYARQYGFEGRAKLPSSFSTGTSRQSKDQDMTKVLGDIFEAYVAAVILSDPDEGVTRVTAWLKDLWGMTLKNEIIEEEELGLKFNSPLWNLKGDARGTVVEAPLLNDKENLQKLLGSKNIKIEYRDAGAEKKDKETKLPLFTVGVYLTGWGAVDKQLGIGSAFSKKDAGMKAAKMALDNKRVLSNFIEKKRVFDANLELERQALANA